jgi:hypothetical protein
MEKREPIGQFCKRTDFMAKLRAALEDVENGQGFEVFEGLQTYECCVVCMTFNGEVVRLTPIEARPVFKAQPVVPSQENLQPQEPTRAERKRQK